MSHKKSWSMFNNLTLFMQSLLLVKTDQKVKEQVIPFKLA